MKKLLVILTLTLVSLFALSTGAFAQLPVASTCSTAVGRVPCAGVQTSDNCQPFDFETEGTWWCANKGYSNRAIFSICNCPETAVNFKSPNKIGIRMTILVNDKSQAQVATPLGAYWADSTATNIFFGKYATLAEACPTGTYDMSFGEGHYYHSSNNLTPTGYSTPIGGTTCAVGTANQATVYVTDRAYGYEITPADEAAGVARWAVNIPLIRVDSTVLHSGETIKVKVEFLLQTGGGICTDCPPICEDTITVAKVCCGESTACYFPYFTSTTGVTAEQPYWNGIAIVNKGGSAGTATLTVYQKDGVTGTFTTPVIEPGSMFVEALENIGFTATGGTLGGIPVSIDVTSTFGQIDGFAMMSNSDNGDSMGYLCRQSQ
ncbi:MAG: hypothetical protein ACYC5X_12130 [Syntrophales bacterium]